ncbi:MAG: nickel pincer cofactor biosynthesis protein LarB, partial [Myxococcales bacterium]|nr:nickel pincer cofactor biosynthesis protein LarB [Myxococcales bacterium]
LRHLPFEDLGFAKVDHHRALRKGFPETIFGAGKTPAQIVSIANRMRENGSNVLATRCAPEALALVAEHVPGAEIHDTARAFTVAVHPPEPLAGYVGVVAAGTSDLPVAEEAARTAELLGNRVERYSDVGVAGIHRLFAVREALQAAEVLVVVAGMEGALPSVVKGLVSAPVVGVPTSVGFGASFGGVSALLSMLNSCAPGMTVVNIDNGFGAGYAASLMNRKRAPRHE